MWNRTTRVTSKLHRGAARIPGQSKGGCLLEAKHSMWVPKTYLRLYLFDFGLLLFWGFLFCFKRSNKNVSTVDDIAVVLTPCVLDRVAYCYCNKKSNIQRYPANTLG